MYENSPRKRSLQAEIVQSEVVVVGAGIAGIAAALTAARQGRPTVLITDRPVLGGSASSEIRVGPGGADTPPWNRFARESGVMEEIYNHIHYRASLSGKWRWFYFDQIYFDLVLREPNLKCFLNTTIHKVTTDKQRILSVEGIQLRAEKSIEFRGKVFIDCTGDGTVGFLAGADYRMGREAKSEYNEKHAPEEADTGTMGATLLFTSVDTGHPVPFKAPEWAIDIRDLPSFPRLSRSIRKMPDGTYYGFWWAEYGGQLHSIYDDAEVIWHLRRLIYGLWDYIKNSGEFSYVDNLEMDWIGYLPGKRESRRLLGPYIATAHDFLNQRDFPDRIGYTGWPIDIHPPGGYLATEPGCTHDYLPGITDIPFRCIYSRNVHNLLFAGRHVSVSHEGLGTLRLIPTTAVMGQAAGLAAVMCVERDQDPQDIYETRMAELQERLVRTDQSLIGYRLREPEDLSRTATVTASGECPVELINPVQSRALETSYGLILPVEGDHLDTVAFYLTSEAPTEVVADVYLMDERPQNYRVKSLCRTVRCAVDGPGWYQFPVQVQEIPGQKVLVLLRKNPQVKVFFDEIALTGVLGIETNEAELTWDSRFREISGDSFLWHGLVPLTPCFRVTPTQRLFRPENINNGYIRPHGLPHLWASGKMRPGQSQWIQLDFAEPKEISRVELVFNSELNHKAIQPSINRVNPQMVHTYELVALTDGGEVSLHLEEENFLRFRVHQFDQLCAQGIRLVVHRTWGHPYAEVYDFRVYP